MRERGRNEFPRTSVLRRQFIAYGRPRWLYLAVPPDGGLYDWSRRAIPGRHLALDDPHREVLCPWLDEQNLRLITGVRDTKLRAVRKHVGSSQQTAMGEQTIFVSYVPDAKSQQNGMVASFSTATINVR
jgi:hypothetical protein